MDEDTQRNADKIEQIIMGGEPLSELDQTPIRDSERPVKVDMWDQECGSEGTVSAAIRHYTAQWGLPRPESESKDKPKNQNMLNLNIRLERDDSIPAFGGFLRCDCPDRDKDHAVILINVQAVMSPELESDDGSLVPMDREERKRLLITTLMHEFGHALESHLNLPDCEDAIESVCEAWEKAYYESKEKLCPTAT